MNLLMEIFGLDPSEYKQREFQWAFEEAGVFFPLMVFLVPLALWFFWTSLSRIKSPVTKSFLFILRAAAFALIIFLLLKPELEFKKKNVLTNTIAVLMDDSKSMSIKTFPDEIPRIDFVKTTLDKNRKFFEEKKLISISRINVRSRKICFFGNKSKTMQYFYLIVPVHHKRVL